MRGRLALLTLALSGLLAPSAGAENTTVAATARTTEIAAGFGVVLYSAYDAGAGNYRLMRLQGGAAAPLPVAPSSRPFQADVGPTRSGRAFYVYTRCGTAVGSCDLFAYNPATGTEQRSKASDPGHDDLHPTYWKGALAFVRDYGTAEEPRQIVYQRPTATTRRSERLPGVPARRCERGGCVTTRADFSALELHGRTRLAQIVRSDEPVVAGGKGRPTETYRSTGVELRLVDRALTRSRRLVRAGRGEGGQSLTGLAITGNDLYVSFSCLGDEGGCTRLRPGIYRYGFATRDADATWALAADDRAIYGLAVDRARIYELRDGEVRVEGVNAGLECDQESFGPPGAPRCALVRRDPTPEFAAIPAP